MPLWPGAAIPDRQTSNYDLYRALYNLSLRLTLLCLTELFVRCREMRLKSDTHYDKTALTKCVLGRWVCLY